MKTKSYFIRVSLVTWMTLIPSIGICITEYNHQKDTVNANKDGMALEMDVF